MEQPKQQQRHIYFHSWECGDFHFYVLPCLSIVLSCARNSQLHPIAGCPHDVAWSIYLYKPICCQLALQLIKALISCTTNIFVCNAVRRADFHIVSHLLVTFLLFLAFMRNSCVQSMRCHLHKNLFIVFFTASLVLRWEFFRIFLGVSVYRFTLIFIAQWLLLLLLLCSYVCAAHTVSLNILASIPIRGNLYVMLRHMKNAYSGCANTCLFCLCNNSDRPRQKIGHWTWT